MVAFTTATELNCCNRASGLQAQNTSWFTRRSLLTRGCSSDGYSVWCKPPPQAFENHSAGLVCEAGLEVYFLRLVFEQQLLKWMWVAGSDSIVQRWRAVGLVMLVTVKIRNKASAPPTHFHPPMSPPKTCIITLIFSRFLLVNRLQDEK